MPFVKSFTFQKFEPSGMVQGGSGRVKMSTSIVTTFSESSLFNISIGMTWLTYLKRIWKPLRSAGLSPQMTVFSDIKGRRGKFR